MDREQLLSVAEYFVRASNKDDGGLVEALRDMGLSRNLSERLVAFLPIAFARVVIAHRWRVSFTTDYKVKETEQIRLLSDEPIFVEALKLAAESYHSGIVSREVFSAIAIRSPELDAVNKALNEGENIDGANFGTVEFFGYKTLGERGWLKRVFG